MHRPDPGEWIVPNGNAWCVYGNDIGNRELNGLLYGYPAVVDPRGLCPEGWHVPTDADWAQLELALGMPVSEVDSLSPAGSGAWRGEGANVGGQLKATTTWDDPNTGANNTSGFAAKASGQRAMPGAGYQGLGTMAAFWTSTSSGFFEGWVRMLRFDRPGIMRLHHHMGSDQPGYGHSCRCIKDQ